MAQACGISTAHSAHRNLICLQVSCLEDTDNPAKNDTLHAERQCHQAVAGFYVAVPRTNIICGVHHHAEPQAENTPLRIVRVSRGWVWLEDAGHANPEASPKQ